MKSCSMFKQLGEIVFPQLFSKVLLNFCVQVFFNSVVLGLHRGSRLDGMVASGLCKHEELETS